jgi:hypothetical protein
LHHRVLAGKTIKYRGGLLAPWWDCIHDF